MLKLRRALMLVAACGSVSAQALRAVAQHPAPHAGHVMTSAGARGVLLAGGQRAANVTGVPDSLQLWDGSAWRIAGIGGPALRTLPAAAFDARRNVFVFHGGHDIASRTTFAETWEWNGERWREITTPGGPGRRDHHAMVFDAARGVSVLYGGAPGSAIFPPETWTYDGTAWRMADSVSGPRGLVHHAMAYDARRQRVVMYGGFVPDRERSTDVWEWDGAKWDRIPSEGPGTRTHHRMAYDAERGVVVMFGGGAADTWTWDGVRWTRAATTGPRARDLHAMAWDDARKRVVLFGGMARGESFMLLGDVWEWDGTTWVER